MSENPIARRGFPIALAHAMRTSLLISLAFLSMAILTGSADRSESAWNGDPDIHRIREDLSAVEIQLLGVMRTDPDTTCALEQRQKQLQYKLQLEPFTRDKSTLRRDAKRSEDPSLACRAPDEMPQT